uniref:Uncharacterized protein n=1 Tax=Magallana gigas TaxID=29159 RepID=K1PZW6_MAGGI
MVDNHDRLKKCVDRDIPHEWFGLGRTLRTLGAKRETGSDLASSPPAGAAGACKLPESLTPPPRQQPRQGRPPKRSDSPPLPPDVGGVPVTDLT